MVAPVVPALYTDQVMVLLVAFVGATVPVRVRSVPGYAVLDIPVIFVTGTKAATVMVKSWV
jgi:hypothetical protein